MSAVREAQLARIARLALDPAATVAAGEAHADAVAAVFGSRPRTGPPGR